MISINNERLNELENKFTRKKIAVIGDVMLDSYVWGNIRRISPEAPVPVVEVENEFYRFGGAANVAYNLLQLGGRPLPMGVIGYDSHGTIFSSLISDAAIDSSCLIVDENRPTTIKTRVIAHNQHVLRIDRENASPVSAETEQKILSALAQHLSSLDGIILQDYNKGVLTAGLIEQVIAMANNAKVLITVDPKFNNFFGYKNVTVFKPNRKEAEDVLGFKIRSTEDISRAGNVLLESLQAQYILLTLGEEGIAVFERGKPERRMPTKARKVADVSGAGDTVISTLTMALAAGADILEASFLANYAAGIVCEEVGIVPIQKDKLFDVIRKNL